MNCGNWEHPRGVENRQPQGVLVGHIMGEEPKMGATEPEGKEPVKTLDVPMSNTQLQGERGESGEEGPAIMSSSSAQGSLEKHNEVYQTTYIPTTYPPVHNKVYCCQEGEAQTE